MAATASRFNETRKVLSGGVTKEDLLQRLGEQSIRLNDYATSLFADPDFMTSREPAELRVAFVSLTEIGLPNGGRYTEILAQAADTGLEACPLELAPHLRLDYQDQPEGPYLTVASLELRAGPETPNGFYLRRLNGELWLRGYESGPENIYQPDFSRFAFLIP